MSNGIPSFKHHGFLVGFAAFKAHNSFFPGSSIQAQKDELKIYDTAKGMISIRPDKPLLASLARKIVRARPAISNGRRRGSCEGRERAGCREG